MKKNDATKKNSINNLPASEKMEAMLRAIETLKKNSPSSDSIRIGDSYLCYHGKK